MSESDSPKEEGSLLLDNTHLLNDNLTKLKRSSSSKDSASVKNYDDDKNVSKQKYLKLENNTKVVASHYNEIKEKGLAERSKSRIFYMRNFNNWIKSMLINDYLYKLKKGSEYNSPLRVLDMCCGKGGDLLKWKKGNITHLICTDIAELSVEQCENRYKLMASKNENRSYSKNFTAEFFTCDATVVRLREKYVDPSILLDMVSCQFAFHYCFESLKQAECMIKNAAECLRPGGFFIGTMPNAYGIMSKQRTAQCDTFGNDIYKISFQCDTSDLPLFGAKYDFFLEDVVNCPEFLVHFPTLEKLAKKYGLELELKESFEDFFHRKIQYGKNLIEKMQGLETYTPQNNSLASQNNEDYEHAENYCNEKNFDKYKKIGTLTKSEWEVAALYMVFVFRKMKKT